MNFAETHVHWDGDAIQPSHPLLSTSPFIFHLMSQFFPSSGQSIGASASNEYWRLISFRTDWFGLLAAQGTLRSLLQHHKLKSSINKSKASLLWSFFSRPCRNTFFMKVRRSAFRVKCLGPIKLELPASKLSSITEGLRKLRQKLTPWHLYCLRNESVFPLHGNQLCSKNTCVLRHFFPWFFSMFWY